MLLREILEVEQIKILSEDEAAEGHTITIRTPFIVMDRKTKNDRVYSKALMTREVKRVQSAVSSGSFLGMGDHPYSGMGNIESTSHIVQKLELDEKSNMGFATLKILDTPKGKIVKTIIREGGRVGLSLRGFGDVINGKVQSNYVLKGLDIVCDPSVSAALFGKENILESVNFDTEEIDEEYILDLQKLGHAQAMENYNYPGTFEEWMEEHGAIYRATALVEQYHLFPTIQEALKSLGETELVEQLNAEDEVKVWTDSDVWVEAKFANIDPKVMAERLNKAEQLKKVNRSSDFSVREAQGLIEEAQAAGKDLSDPKERKAYLEKIAKNRSPGELSLNEKSFQIQERLKTKGTEATLETIQAVLVFEDEKAEIERRRMSIRAQAERDIDQSGAFKSHEESRKFINRQLRAANLPILTEDE